MNAVLVDDELLALKRLERLLANEDRIDVEAAFSDPEEAFNYLCENTPDVLFLDIQMPGMTGFELLARLENQPLVVFTTAYDEYALKAFEVNSIDYLMKPIESGQLERAVSKIERIRGGSEPKPAVDALLSKLSAALKNEAAYPARISSKLGERTAFVELKNVTHFYAKDKLTFAATGAKDYVVDYTITELERKLDPARFVRIHRSTLLNVDFVLELFSWFGDRLMIRLKDKDATELTVSRDRTRQLKDCLGL
jgi:two-component system, LytTR family, response regulator